MTSPSHPPHPPQSRTRIHAAPLTGRGWLNTGGRDLSLEELRGKFVLLDFWTFCCVNCLHVLDELRELEAEFADVLVVIGVHSPKFPHEADPVALRAAIDRYGVAHPVLDDPNLVTWDAYVARAWPTLTLIDPEGYVVAQMAGEGHAHGLAVLLRELMTKHEAAGTLNRGDGPYVAPPALETSLRFPGKVMALPTGTFLVSDTAHHQLVELAADLHTELRRFGTGQRGFADGAAADAAFSEPHGMTLLPDSVAAVVGYDVVVADSVNHALRGLRLADGTVTTVAGTGELLRQRSGGGPALEQELSTPWDVAYFADRIVVAMAGTHQLWSFDPVAATVAVLAGTSAEGLRDGAALDSHFAQPSGLAVSADGQRLWIADSETSALRYLAASTDGSSGFEVRTVIGVGLFDFGHVDGSIDSALMQHPLGLTELPDGSIAVCDTYNGAIRRFDPVAGEMSTMATGLREPSDAVVVAGDDGPLLVVVESAAHRLEPVQIPARAQQVKGEAHQLQRAATTLAPGHVILNISFTPPSGQKLDDRFGDPTRLDISSSPAGLLLDGAGAQAGLQRELRLNDAVTDGVLHISVQAAACDGDPVTGETPEFAACHLYQQDWGIPVTIAADGARELELPLRQA